MSQLGRYYVNENVAQRILESIQNAPSEHLVKRGFRSLPLLYPGIDGGVLQFQVPLKGLEWPRSVENYERGKAQRKANKPHDSEDETERNNKLSSRKKGKGATRQAQSQKERKAQNVESDEDYEQEDSSDVSAEESLEESSEEEDLSLKQPRKRSKKTNRGPEKVKRAKAAKGATSRAKVADRQKVQLSESTWIVDLETDKWVTVPYVWFPAHYKPLLTIEDLLLPKPDCNFSEAQRLQKHGGVDPLKMMQGQKRGPSYQPWVQRLCVFYLLKYAPKTQCITELKLAKAPEEGGVPPFDELCSLLGIEASYPHDVKKKLKDRLARELKNTKKWLEEGKALVFSHEEKGGKHNKMVKMYKFADWVREYKTPDDIDLARVFGKGQPSGSVEEKISVILDQLRPIRGHLTTEQKARLCSFINGLEDDGTPVEIAGDAANTSHTASAPPPPPFASKAAPPPPRAARDPNIDPDLEDLGVSKAHGANKSEDDLDDFFQTLASSTKETDDTTGVIGDEVEREIQKKSKGPLRPTPPRSGTRKRAGSELSDTFKKLPKLFDNSDPDVGKTSYLSRVPAKTGNLENPSTSTIEPSAPSNLTHATPTLWVCNPTLILEAIQSLVPQSENDLSQLEWISDNTVYAVCAAMERPSFVYVEDPINMGHSNKELSRGEMKSRRWDRAEFRVHIIPFCGDTGHWTVTVIVPETFTVYMLDSGKASGFNASHRARMRALIIGRKDAWGDVKSFTWVRIDSQQQTDFVSCAVFALRNMQALFHHLSGNDDIPVKSNDVGFLRYHLAQLLVDCVRTLDASLDLTDHETLLRDFKAKYGPSINRQPDSKSLAPENFLQENILGKLKDMNPLEHSISAILRVDLATYVESSDEDCWIVGSPIHGNSPSSPKGKTPAPATHAASPRAEGDVAPPPRETAPPSPQRSDVSFQGHDDNGTPPNPDANPHLGGADTATLPGNEVAGATEQDQTASSNGETDPLAQNQSSAMKSKELPQVGQDPSQDPGSPQNVERTPLPNVPAQISIEPASEVEPVSGEQPRRPPKPRKDPVAALKTIQKRNAATKKGGKGKKKNT